MSKLKYYFKLIMFLFLSFTINNIIKSQDSISIEKKEARMSLSYINHNNNGPWLEAKVKTKVERSYVNIEGLKIDYYFEKVDKEGHLGYAISDKDGKATLIVPETLHKVLLHQDTLLFYAILENDKEYDDLEEEITIIRTQTSLDFEIEDSIKYVNFFVGYSDNGEIIPAEEIEARIYVKRLFGLLPISDEGEVTDENGILSIEFPNDIKGDTSGNVTIVAKIDDNDEFGNLVYTKNVAWGNPLIVNKNIINRELWSSRNNAPISLVIITTTMIVGIWSIIAYIVFQLIKINKLGLKEEN